MLHSLKKKPQQLWGHLLLTQRESEELLISVIKAVQASIPLSGFCLDQTEVSLWSRQSRDKEVRGRTLTSLGISFAGFEEAPCLIRQQIRDMWSDRQENIWETAEADWDGRWTGTSVNSMKERPMHFKEDCKSFTLSVLEFNDTAGFFRPMHQVWTRPERTIEMKYRLWNIQPMSDTCQLRLYKLICCRMFWPFICRTHTLLIHSVCQTIADWKWMH